MQAALLAAAVSTMLLPGGPEPCSLAAVFVKARCLLGARGSGARRFTCRRPLRRHHLALWRHVEVASHHYDDEHCCQNQRSTIHCSSSSRIGLKAVDTAVMC